MFDTEGYLIASQADCSQSFVAAHGIIKVCEGEAINDAQLSSFTFKRERAN